MQYELLKHRGLAPSDSIPSMTLMYLYSKCKKDREEGARKAKLTRTK